MSCVFCEIIQGKIPTEMRYKDEHVVAFDDNEPKAPVHFLVVPRIHIDNLNHWEEHDSALTGHVVTVAIKLAKAAGLSENGYRLVMNCLKDGGQCISHVHCHVLGGRQLQWPPG